MANVGEVLPRRGAQQLQEGHLHFVNGVVCHVDIVQLGTNRGEREREVRVKKESR